MHNATSNAFRGRSFLRVPKILVLLFALFCCCFCFVAVVFLSFLFCLFVFFSVLVQDLHPTEIGDMYFRFHYIFLASSPHTAPDERGRAHPPLCNGEGWGGEENMGREKAIRKRRKETRSAPQPVQADTASPGRAGPVRAGPLRCPQARGRAAGTPARQPSSRFGSQQGK